MSEETYSLQPLSLLLTLLFAPIVAHNYIDGSRGLKRGVHVQGNRVSYGNFAVDKFHRLQVSVGSSTLVSNYRECALSCVNNPPCSSFNVASSPRSDGKYRCELLNEVKYSANPGQLVSSQEYHHYSIKTPCSSWPCRNGGKCVPDYEQGDFSCTCQPGYTGKTCQTETDECSSSPCKNRATCIDQVNGFRCVCKAGYSGKQCKTDINECSSNPCKNGAICTDQVNGYTCQCAAGFTGIHCETVSVSYPKTCTGVKLQKPSATNGHYMVDPDGDGGITALSVYCYFGAQSWTLFRHDLPSEETVDGYEAPGSYIRKVNYVNSLSQIAKVISVSTYCRQYISYKCSKSRLMATYDGLGGPYGWWVSRDGQNQYYWGGAVPGSYSCGCYKAKNCYKYPKFKCNCDANDLQWREDTGYLEDKSTLPVTELRFGDTGSSGKDQGKYALGSLQCYGQI
ncbi:hypothetical protein ACROYT_G039970 [Oculina patagonica]